MTKSDFAKAVDAIQKELRPHLREAGFRVRGRTFNRTTEGQLIQVINLQMGQHDPPATTYHLGLRENLHGLFTINLGVYVPEVARLHMCSEAGSWVQDYHCCVRSRLAEACGETDDIWWHARQDDDVLASILGRLQEGGLPFLERFSTRDKILTEWKDRRENLSMGDPPKIVCAIILFERGEKRQAGQMLADQIESAEDTGHHGHAEYVRELAGQLNLNV